MEFNVKVRRIYSETLYITANSAKEALDIVRDADTMGEINPELEAVNYELV